MCSCYCCVESLYLLAVVAGDFVLTKSILNLCTELLIHRIGVPALSWRPPFLLLQQYAREHQLARGTVVADGQCHVDHRCLRSRISEAFNLAWWVMA